VHTSAKVRLISVTIRIRIQIRIRIRDPDLQQNLIICSLARCQPSLKIHDNPFGSFCAKLLTDRQTNNDNFISSLAEVINQIFLSLTESQQSPTFCPSP